MPSQLIYDILDNTIGPKLSFISISVFSANHTTSTILPEDEIYYRDVCDYLDFTQAKHRTQRMKTKEDCVKVRGV